MKPKGFWIKNTIYKNTNKINNNTKNLLLGVFKNYNIPITDK